MCPGIVKKNMNETQKNCKRCVLELSRISLTLTFIASDTFCNQGHTLHFGESPTNVLTNPALDPVAKIPETKVCAVRVEKLEEQEQAIIPD
jgi:predicted molibdopterin-dependent oxidoreductase YjgC